MRQLEPAPVRVSPPLGHLSDTHRQQTEALTHLAEALRAEALGRTDQKVLALEQKARERRELSDASEKLNAQLLVQIAVRKQAEEASRDSEDRLRRALDSAELGYWNIDFVTDIFSADERFRLIFSGSNAELSYAQCTEIVHADDRDQVSELVAAATRLNDPIAYEAEY